MQKIPVFESQVNADSTEGRGPMIHVGYFTHRNDAEHSVRGQGTMGIGNGVVFHTEIVIFESYAEFDKETKNELRQSALAKLSGAEREALGL